MWHLASILSGKPGFHSIHLSVKGEEKKTGFSVWPLDRPLRLKAAYQVTTLWLSVCPVRYWDASQGQVAPHPAEC